MSGTSIAIPLPNAHLLSFIQVFNNIDHCQNHINTNNTKTFTLFVYRENILTWIRDNNGIPHNLLEIIVFCPPSDDQESFNSWADRFIQIKDIITHDELDRKTLLFGIKYVRRFRSEFQHNQGIMNLLNEDHRRMCLALADSFIQEADSQQSRTRRSVENS